MNGKLAAVSLTSADTATSVYKCRTTGAAFISVSICNRSAETAEITLGVSDSANSSDVASIIEYKTELLPKNVLERTGVAVSSTQYLTVTSSVANVSVVATGVETGTFDDSIPEIPPTWSLSSTLDNPNAYDTSYNDRFGNSVAVSGDYAIVGAFFEDELGLTDAGKAYIYNAISGALVHTLDNPDDYAALGSDNFGISVAISGNYAIVGAPKKDDAGGTRSGKAYIYNAISGALVHTLDNPNAYGTSEGDWFGYRVAISGNYAIVGAYLEDDAGGLSSGKAYIYNAISGALLHTLDNPNAYGTSEDDSFGNSIAISGNYAIVGAYDEDDAGGETSGKAYIFNVTSGALVHTLDNPNDYGTSAVDVFGYSVAISGNYAIVSAYREDDAGGTRSGKAYIFNVTSGALVHTLDNPNAYGTSEDDFFGNSVAISSDYAVVGANIEDDAPDNNRSGKAYIFDLATGSLFATLDNPNAYGTSTEDFFGREVAISGNVVIISALESDAGYGSNGANSGKAYIYQLS